MSESVKIMRLGIDEEEIKRTVRKEVLAVLKELAEEEGTLTPARLSELAKSVRDAQSGTVICDASVRPF